MQVYSNPEEVKVATVGYSGIARVHLNQIKAAGMTPAAVVDLKEEQRKTAEEEFPGIATFADLSQMLQDCETDMSSLSRLIIPTLAAKHLWPRARVPPVSGRRFMTMSQAP